MKQPGRRTQIFIGEESPYGTAPALAATHAIRHRSASIDFDVLNRALSPEKKVGPGRYVEFDRRGTAAGSLEALLRPSGTINTLPECSPLLKAGFGSVVNTSLSTTVASSGTVSGATLTSASGMAIGNPLLITCPDGKKRVRFITAVNTGTGVTTWAPQLPAGQQPANGAAVKCGALYKLTSALAISLFMARYTYQADLTSGLGEILYGWGIDRLSLAFDYADEPMLSASGPGQRKADAPSHPGGFTQVGTNPPTAMTAEALIGNNAIKFMKLSVEIANGLQARNDELNSTYPTELYRMGDRDVTVALDMMAENGYKSAIYDLAMAGTLASVFQQTGFTEGKIVACYLPRVDFKPPTVNVPDGAVEWPFRGRALENTEDANDELWLGLC